MSELLDPLSDPDERVLDKIRSGDIEAFESLVEKYKRQVFMIVAGHIPNTDVEEVAHEAFLRAFKSLASFAGKSPFQHWLLKITTRTCCDYWRKHYRSLEQPVSSMTPEQQEWTERVLAADSSSRHDDATRKEAARELLQRAMSGLSPEERSVLTLVHLEGQSVREAADRLGYSLINTKVRLHRARKKLRKAVESILEAEDFTS